MNAAAKSNDGGRKAIANASMNRYTKLHTTNKLMTVTCTRHAQPGLPVTKFSAMILAVARVRRNHGNKVLSMHRHGVNNSDRCCLTMSSLISACDRLVR